MNLNKLKYLLGMWWTAGYRIEKLRRVDPWLYGVLYEGKTTPRNSLGFFEGQGVTSEFRLIAWQMMEDDRLAGGVGRVEVVWQEEDIREHRRLRRDN